MAAGLFLKNQLSDSRKISVICSSDDDRILDLVKKNYSSSVLAVRRKPELSDDNAILSDVIFDCIYRLAERQVIRLDEYLSGSFILLQPTSPIRLKDDLVSFCKQIKNLGSDLSMVSVNKNYSAVKDIYEINNLDFVIGSDLISDIIYWKKFEKIIEEVNFFIIEREGHPIKSINLKILEKYRVKFKISTLNIPNISSSTVRLNTNYSYLPKSLVDIVKKNNLYLSKNLIE